MFISTDTDLINTDNITSAHYEPSKEAENPDDWNADENGMIPASLTVYFPVGSGEGDYGRTSFEFTGEAAIHIWNYLQAGGFHLDWPTRHPIDREAKRQNREAARAAHASADDLPW